MNGYIWRRGWTKAHRIRSRASTVCGRSIHGAMAVPVVTNVQLCTHCAREPKPNLDADLQLTCRRCGASRELPAVWWAKVASLARFRREHATCVAKEGTS